MTRPCALLCLVCAAVGCGGSAASDPCDLDRETIATWVASARLGNRPLATDVARRWDDFRGSSRVALEEPAVGAWCTARGAGIDSACFTSAGDGRRECLSARQELLAVSVTGPLCELDGKWLVSEWDSGVTLDISTDDAYAKYIAAIAAKMQKLETVPMPLICMQTAGFPLVCYLDRAAIRCRRFATLVAYWQQLPI